LGENYRVGPKHQVTVDKGRYANQPCDVAAYHNDFFRKIPDEFGLHNRVLVSVSHGLPMLVIFI
jgi:hypothetical protein